jgi:uncharacterized delta-60 repeat protein
MSKIPFDPTTNPGIGRNLRTFITPKLLIPALLMALFWVPGAAAQSAETVSGKPGRANFRSVINFKGTALLEERRRQTNTAPQRAIHAPFPRGSDDWSGPPRDDGGGVQSVPPSQAPQSQSASQNSIESIAASTGAPPPPMAVSFLALEDNNTVIPPDTHGAVGPNHVMTSLNSGIRIQDRRGTNISTVSLTAFWASLGVTDVFDPKTLYDPYANRWITTAMAQSRSPASSTLIGVSQTSDPTGSWNLYRADADTNNLRWVDYPSIGFNKDWIVVSANMFPTFFTFGQLATVNLWVFNKTNLYTNGVGLFTLLQENSGRGFTMVPAQTFDQQLSTMYLVEVDQLLQNFFGSGSFLRLSTISGPVGSELLTLGERFVTATNSWFNLDPFIPGFLPQLSTNAFFDGIDGGDARIRDVVYRNGTLWCAHTVFLPADFPVYSAAQWWQFTPDGELLQFGRVEDPSGINSYAYPSIAVNRCNDVLIGFSSFSTNQFPSASYAFRKASDPPNLTSDPAIMKPGEASYFKTYGGFLNRWGDYSGTVVDPVNDLDMWTIQEYAAAPLNGLDRWGTWWGKLDLVGSGGGRVEFFSSSFTANEAPPPGFATITVLNIGGGAGSVDYFTSDGSAIAGLDYRPTSGTLAFASGQTVATFPIEIIDNPDPHPDKTVFLTITNVQGGPVLGCLTNSVLTILDDETRSIPNNAGQFNFSSFVNYGFPYEVTENESESAFSFQWFCDISGSPNRKRSPLGALITVVRTNGATGRCLVDYATIEGATAIPFVDYLPTSGTLIFDDYQMSANFLVPVLSDSFFFLLDDGHKFVNIALSNPRLDTNEVIANPLLPQPTLGAGSVAGLWIYSVNNGICTNSFTATNVTQNCANAFSFERLRFVADEYPNLDPRTPGGVNFVDISVILPLTGPGRVGLDIVNFQKGIPMGWFLNAGSDHFINPTNDFQVWPNPFYTDTSLTVITNGADITNIVDRYILSFGDNQCRLNFRLWITNDSEVEFNEDLFVNLVQLGGEPQVNFIAGFALVTILQDDQAAGALDREWNADNVPDTPEQAFNLSPGANNTVRSIAVQSNFKAIIGGDFDSYNGVKRDHIARINPDGSLDTLFNSGLGANQPVQAVYVYPTNSPFGDRILLAGNFSSYDGTTRYGIVRLMPNGQIDPSFNPGNGASIGEAVGPIYAMAVQADGKIVVAGDFTEFNDIARFGIARLHTNGALDLSFDAGLAADGPIWSVALTTNASGGEKILVGGEFFTFDLEVRPNIVQLLPDGTVDPNFLIGGGASAGVYAIGVQTNGQIVIAGAFNIFDARIRNKVARLNSDGSLDETFSPALGPDFPVYSLLIQPDQKAVIGGMFTDYNGTRRRALARLRLDGSLDTSFMDTAYNHFAGFTRPLHTDSPHSVLAIALQPDGNFMVGGTFDTVGGNPSYRMPLRNTHTVFTRNDKRTRMNVARILGGVTPGPGNAEFDTDNYFVDENGRVASLRLRRVDGRLGTLVAEAATVDRTAYQGIDYQATNLVSVWPEGFYQTNINITFPIVFPTNWAPISVGSVEANYLSVPILEDIAEEGDELLDLGFIRPIGSITLGGEYIPIGGALGRSSARLTIADNDFSRGTFNFLHPVFYTNELAPGGLAQITVIRTNGSAGRVTVDWLIVTNVAPPRASPNLDYDARSVRGTITFNPGVTTRTFFVTVWQDSEMEFDENVGLILTNATGGAKLPGGLATSTATAMLTIIDNNFPPGRLNFAVDTFNFNETDGEATITVTRTGGSDSQVSVDFQTINGTAIAPADYASTNGVLFWDSGETAPKTFKVPLRLDGLVEGNEAVKLRLVNPLVRGLTETNLLGQRASANLAILDGDAYGLVGFKQPFYQTDENGGFIDITVFRTVGTSGSGSVQYATIADTAIPNQDFTAVSDVLNFGPGEIGKTFRVPILDDGQSDGNRTVFLQLSSPVNVGLAVPSTVVLSIMDNESFREPPGDLDVAFRADTKANGPVYTIAPQYTAGLLDGRLMVAGDFTEFNEVTRNRLARLLDNGVLDTSFNPGIGANASIRTMVVQRDGKILVGGFFDQIVSTNLNGIARLSHDGSLDESFNPGAAADVPAIHSIVIQPDEKILVGGGFAKFNNLPSAGIVRLTTNGIVDRTFNVGGGANAAVYAIAIQNDGKILIGGDFTSVNNFTSPRLARLNLDGSVDSSFNIGLGCDGAVRSIVVQPDGKILIGGSFTRVGNTPRNFVARLEPGGAVDTTFLNSDIGADNAVYSLALQVDGRVVVVGDFTRFNGVGRNRITRVMSDGSIDTSINFGAGANSFISALYLQPDRKIVIGGGFTTYDEQPRLHIARIYGGTVAGAGGIEFSRAEYSVDENGTNTLISVRRRGGTAGIVGADFRTVDLTAIAGQDYIATSGTLTFPAGETEQSFIVPVLDNFVPNVDRVARLELLNYSGGVTNGPKPAARLVFRNDEVLVGFVNTNYVTSESIASGLQNITVARTLGSNTAFSIEFQTAAGTAIPFQDFTSTNGTLTFNPGELTKNFQVPIIDDSAIEGTESLNLRLSNPSAKTFLALDRATVEIHDNDFAPGQVFLSSSNYIVNEAGAFADITIIRTNGSTGFISVRLATLDITAQARVDYSDTNTTVAFADGETLKVVRIPILIDFISEPTETFSVSIFNPTGGAVLLNPSVATVSIINNDRPYGTFVFSTNFKAAAENIGFAPITIYRINGSLNTVSVNLATAGTTAVPGVDFESVSTNLVFPPGLTNMSIFIPLFDDNLQEGSENFSVSLSGASSGAAVGTPSFCVVQIVDNDSPILVAAGATLVSETNNNGVIDPGERVTLRLGIRNIGFTNTANLFATVQTSGGVFNPTPVTASYGVVAANGPTNFQNFALTANVPNNGLLTVTLALTNNGQNLGTVEYQFRVGSLTYEFANPTPITINDETNAFPYPSAIFVSDISGTITKVTATLSNINHTFPDDVDILLVSPAGDAVMLMSDAGGGTDVTDVTIRYTDSAPSAPADNGLLFSGDCLPSNYSDDDSPVRDFFAPPVPTPTSNWPTNMSRFNGKNPNGTWALYVMDDTIGDNGSIAGGWSLSITTSSPVNDTTPPSMQYIGILPNGRHRVAVRGQAGLRYTLSGSHDLRTYAPITTFTMPNGGIYYHEELPAAACKFFRASRVP